MLLTDEKKSLVFWDRSLLTSKQYNNDLTFISILCHDFKYFADFHV